MEQQMVSEEEVCEERERGLEAWVIAAWGRHASQRFEAPVEIAGWERRPWVELRPLTHRENLERESLGIVDEYTIGGSFGDEWQVSRRYDMAAMREYEYGHCIVDYLLPETDEEGQIVPRRYDSDNPQEAAWLLDELPSALAAWLDECIDKVNLRGEGERAALARVKKAC